MTKVDSLTFDGFRELALADGLSRYERIGFPDEYRAGHEHMIFRDICEKLTNINGHGDIVLDIGCGCSELPQLLIHRCRAREHELVMCDSPEMLAHLKDEPFLRKCPGRFPKECDLTEYVGRVQAILVYSVLQYVFVESSIFDFLDSCLELLAPGGQLLLGDLPNASKRKRFFASENGQRFHQEFMKTTDLPTVEFNVLERSKMDDAVILSLVARARSSGFDAYIVPQAFDLPMANRREDILIVRP